MQKYNTIEVLKNQDLKANLNNLAKSFSKSEMCPKAFKDKPDEIYIAILKGLELGISPMQACQSICVVNGTPMLYGSIVYSLGMSHTNFENYDVEYKDNFETCKATIFRKKGNPIVFEYTKKEAEAEGLLSRDVWKKHLKKMLWRRATRVAFEMAFPDAYAGISLSEEEKVEDIQKIQPTTKLQQQNVEIQEIELEVNIPENASEIMEKSQKEFEEKRQKEIAEMNKQETLII